MHILKWERKREMKLRATKKDGNIKHEERQEGEAETLEVASQ